MKYLAGRPVPLEREVQRSILDYLAARGIPAFRVQLFRIQPKDLNHLITQSADN